MPRQPAHSHNDLVEAIERHIRETGRMPTYAEARIKIVGPVGRDRLSAAFAEVRRTRSAAQRAITDPETGVADAVAALVMRAVDGSPGYRLPRLKATRAIIERTLKAIERECHRHDTQIAPYIARIEQLEARQAADRVGEGRIAS